jgi:tripartite-type tricarboxylate transporter receptor subunit TctC
MKAIRSMAFALMALCGGTAAAAYPEKPIKIIVPFPAGQTTDIISRSVANELTKVLNQSVYIDNKGGAGGIIGVEAAKRSPADGYTVLIASSGPLAINPSLYPDIPYNTMEDFEPVAMIIDVPQFLITRSDFPAKTLPELIKYVKERQGDLNYGSGGVGLTNHLTMEMLKNRTDMNVRHIPYRGASAALAGLIGGDTDMMFESGPAIMPHVKAGRLNVLAVGSRKGSTVFPDVKSVHDLGIDGFDAATWMAVMVPKGTPADVIQTLNKSINQVLALPAMQEGFHTLTASAHIATPEETRKFLERELALWKDTIVKGNIRAE